MASSAYRPRYAVGYEWTNHRGQVFVQQPEHPLARGDGFVARSKLVMEALMVEGLPPESSFEDYALGRKGHLEAKERVYHIDKDVENDSPENLLLFPDQRTLVGHISRLAKADRAASNKATLDDFNSRVRELREKRMAAARKGAEAARKARKARPKP